MIALHPTPVLTTDRLVLRAPVAADWPHFRDFALTDRAQFVRAPEIDARLAWRGFGHVIGMWVLRGYGQFIYHLPDDPAPLGMTGPWFPEGWPEREIGWSVWSPAAEGKGLAHEAARAARDYAFGVLGWDTAVSYIHPANARSIALAERLGAVRDDRATQPDPDQPCLVYRHPAPGGRA